MDLITDNRRNPDLGDQAPMVRLSLTQETLVEQCIFRNHYGMGLTEAGGKNVHIRNNLFHNVGKDDGPYQAVWCQSYGNPQAPTGTYQDSENIVVEHNTFRDLERGAALFAPTKGGKLLHNRVTDVGELGFYLPDNVNCNGGTTEVAFNTIVGVRVTDIVANGIELGVSNDIDIHDNSIEDTDGAAIWATGCKRVRIYNNTTLNCYCDHTLPYGPFSERYSFGVGTAPIAGDSKAVADGRVFTIGTLAAVGCDKFSVPNNLIRETRGTYPWVFAQTKSGGVPANSRRSRV